uniref:ATP-binding protein n=1 Tax=Pseudomonas fulva TaxID=47880 RepID=UPI001F345D03|nr:ATP-binding protein [Pseudomonas fulva]
MTLGQKNLVVGKNSTGKTRALNIIVGIARQLSSSKDTPINSDYTAVWEHEGKEYVYHLVVVERLVKKEVLSIDGENLLERYFGGVGQIWAERIGEGQFIPFQTPENEVAIFKRRDSIQHSFIEPLYSWASQVRYYRFGSSLGKDNLTIFMPNGPTVDDRDDTQVAGIFREGVKQFGQPFIDAIVADLSTVGYKIKTVAVAPPISVRFEGAPGELSAVQIEEEGVNCAIDQLSMSQGMYRVLALFIHVNYIQMKGYSTCVVVDDIGEGLDYERSCKVINALRQKSDHSKVQVVMSTNDRFVMNEVPLKEWTVLHRFGSLVKVSNYNNAAEKFDEFRFTGLSNFSFFEMDYLREAEAP